MKHIIGTRLCERLNLCPNVTDFLTCWKKPGQNRVTEAGSAEATEELYVLVDSEAMKVCYAGQTPLHKGRMARLEEHLNDPRVHADRWMWLSSPGAATKIKSYRVGLVPKSKACLEEQRLIATLFSLGKPLQVTGGGRVVLVDDYDDFKNLLAPGTYDAVVTHTALTPAGEWSFCGHLVSPKSRLPIHHFYQKIPVSGFPQWAEKNEKRIRWNASALLGRTSSVEDAVKNVGRLETPWQGQLKVTLDVACNRAGEPYRVYDLVSST